MRLCKAVSAILVALLLIVPLTNCRRASNEFVVALGDNISTLDPIGSPTVDAASERVRVLMFNSLVRKNEKFDYVGELAEDPIQRSDDGMTYTFKLHDNVKFQDGRVLTSADAKYTLDTLLTSASAKSASFYEGAGAQKQSYIQSVEAPDALTLVVRLTKPWTGLLSNLVPISVIPQGSAAQQKDHPFGSGPFKFISYDSSQQVLELEGFENYWQGAPAIKRLRVRVIGDANAIQAELKSGRVDIAPLNTNLSPDAFKSLGQDPNLQVLQFSGSNVNLLTFNTESAPLDNPKVRQAIAYAIDRESMIKELLLGQAKLAHSILPEESWAYTPGTTYTYNPQRAKELLDEAGFRDPDGDGPQMRFQKPIVFKISATSTAARQYAGVIQNALKQIGIPIDIQTSELNTLLTQLRLGQFQIAYGQWVGGNQDPIFYNDLFASSEIPSESKASRNRSRYSNKEVDALLAEAVRTPDRTRARELYTKIQEIISRDAPILPLWYQANMVVAKKTVGNIQVNASGDWSFLRSATIENR